MRYKLFLFDADDTLFDFKSAEKKAFVFTIESLLSSQFDLTDLYTTYRIESQRLWGLLEAGQVSKDVLKIERFRQTFEKHGITADASRASAMYLEALSEADDMNDHAVEICQCLAGFGEIGIVTNGIVSVQKRRLAKSSISQYISFMAVSEECHFAKPDVRFFEYSIKLAKSFSKSSTLVIGDRIETDILGANNFGVSSCLYNPDRLSNATKIKPTHEIFCLSELKNIVAQS